MNVTILLWSYVSVAISFFMFGLVTGLHLND